MVYYMNCKLAGDGLTVAEEDGKLVCLSFGSYRVPDAEERETDLLKAALGQLKEYFDGVRREFDLPLAPRGTDFQRRVWEALREIPYGETRSYKEIALRTGNGKACRAVGMANNRNPLGIVIPCHRVVGSDGRLVGYAGGLDRKRRLLELERRGSGK